LLNLELRYDIQPTLQLAAFIDHGEVRLHKNEWAGWQGANPRISNWYGLTGLGLSLNWTQPGNFMVRASLAQPIGLNAGRDIKDNDSDGAGSRTRLWLQAVKYL
jgi:hemolysin activation/secretion protein